MNKNSMSLKSRIKNFAKENKISAQVILQNYMFERFIERISKSDYKDKFILKGGILIASIVGINNRATMDLDTTLINFPMKEENLIIAIKKICSINVEDNVTFSYDGIELIRKDENYGGFRIGITGHYEKIISPLKIDVTTGDVITPKEIVFKYKKIFESETIPVLAYNIETIMAEKFETILRRGELNTRPRDFYDIYVLVMTKIYDVDIFKKALNATTKNRETQYILIDLYSRIKQISESTILKIHWEKYQKSYDYSRNINYRDIINVIEELVTKITKS